MLDNGFVSRLRQAIHHFFAAFRPALWPTQPPIKWGSFIRGEPLVRSPPSSTEVKNPWIYISAPHTSSCCDAPVSTGRTVLLKIACKEASFLGRWDGFLACWLLRRLLRRLLRISSGPTFALYFSNGLFLSIFNLFVVGVSRHAAPPSCSVTMQFTEVLIMLAWFLEQHWKGGGCHECILEHPVSVRTNICAASSVVFTFPLL